MSKGGGAKVYFVLYLAVVLELLIIIVERDEAEEHLHAKQKEAMKIVQSILSQLQTGSGTEGINTRPQDEISFAPDGISEADLGVKIKSSRKYIVEVGVTNVASELKQREGEEPKEFRERIEKMTELANVTELEYSVFECKDNDPNNCPIFPTDDEIVDKGGINKLSIGSDLTKDGKNWKLLTKAKLEIDEEATAHNVTSNMANISKSTLEPTYKAAKFEGSEFRPTADMLPGEQTFYYSTDETKKSADAKGSRGIDKRSFVVNFQPSKGGPGQTSWYKLYFTSKTNKILGVKKLKGDNEVNLDDSESKVNIGTVQLKTKDLKKVMSEIERDVQASLPPEVLYEEFKKKQDVQLFDKALQNAESEAKKTDAEKANKIKLYGYIVKLLVPGLSASFEQNKGSIQFNVRVVMPKSQIVKPTTNVKDEYVAFDNLPASIDFTVSPYMPERKPMVEILDESGKLIETISDVKLKTQNPVKNEKVEFVAFSSRNLQGNQTYKIVVTYTTGSGGATKEEKPLFVFKAKEADGDALNVIEPKYGESFNYTLKHRSTAKINQGSYRYYMSTDLNPAGQYLSEVKNYSFPANAKKVIARVAWFDSERNKEVDVYEKDFLIKLPNIQDLGRLSPSNVKQTETTAGISISLSTTARVAPLSSGKYPDVEVNVLYQKGKMSKGNLANFKNKTLNLTPNSEGIVAINFKDFISGNPDSESNTLRGDFTINLVIKSKHPTFEGVKSSDKATSFLIKFNKNFDE